MRTIGYAIQDVRGCWLHKSKSGDTHWVASVTGVGTVFTRAQAMVALREVWLEGLLTSTYRVMDGVVTNWGPFRRASYVLTTSKDRVEPFWRVVLCTRPNLVRQNKVREYALSLTNGDCYRVHRGDSAQILIPFTL